MKWAAPLKRRVELLDLVPKRSIVVGGIHVQVAAQNAFVVVPHFDKSVLIGRADFGTKPSHPVRAWFRGLCLGPVGIGQLLGSGHCHGATSHGKKSSSVHEPSAILERRSWSRSRSSEQWCWL